jgi:hypothetical protein
VEGIEAVDFSQFRDASLLRNHVLLPLLVRHNEPVELCVLFPATFFRDSFDLHDLSVDHVHHAVRKVLEFLGKHEVTFITQKKKRKSEWKARRTACVNSPDRA